MVSADYEGMQEYLSTIDWMEILSTNLTAEALFANKVKDFYNVPYTVIDMTCMYLLLKLIITVAENIKLAQNPYGDYKLGSGDFGESIENIPLMCLYLMYTRIQIMNADD